MRCWRRCSVLRAMAALRIAPFARTCIVSCGKAPIEGKVLSQRAHSFKYNLRWKSAATTSLRLDELKDYKPKNEAEPPESPGEDQSSTTLDVSFENAQDAYRSKTTWEIIRALIVFNICSNSYLVDNNHELMKRSKQILGKRLFEALMQLTIYGHFVAGENQTAIRPALQRLRQFGVKAILDYSVEEDMSEEEAARYERKAVISATTEGEKPVPIAPQIPEKKDDKSAELEKYHPAPQFMDRRVHVTSARTYFYMNEAQCERNMDIFLKCIDAVSGQTGSTGFAAIKMTALGRPQLLMQLSETIARTRTYFEEVTGRTGNVILQNIKQDHFIKRFREEHISTESAEIKKWLSQMTYDQKGLIHLFSWSGLIDSNMLLTDMFKVPSLKTGRMERIISSLTEEEEEMFRNMMRRLHTIARRAVERDVRVMVDAEQTYFQPAISRITMEMMRKYNREKAVIFNTYQCYLKDVFNNVVLDVTQALRQNFYFGAKLVRGAYMDQERERAETVGYEDPINPTYESTNMMYEKTLTECLQQIKENGPKRQIAVMVATHNEDTIRFTVNKMRELGIGPRDRVVCFGQLYGMCDQVSFPLGQAGYSVYKYVPYGPISDVLPYLSRRAQENRGFFAKVQKEKRLLWSELKRRLLAGQLIYTPKGQYPPA